MREQFTVEVRRFDGSLPNLTIHVGMPLQLNARRMRTRMALAMQRFRRLERWRGPAVGDLCVNYRAAAGEPWLPVFEVWDGRPTRERLRLNCPFRTDWEIVRAALADTRARWHARYRHKPAPPPVSADVLPFTAGRRIHRDDGRC